MKKSLLFAMALAAIFIMSSCTKTSNSETIVIGDPDGMIVTTYDSTFLPYTHTFDEDLFSELYKCGSFIDLNGDGVKDIQIESLTGSEYDNHNPELFSKTSIMAVEYNTVLSYESLSNNKYTHCDTTDIIYGDTIRVYKNIIYSCEKTYENDFCQEFYTYQAIAYNKGDHLSIKDISPQFPIHNPCLEINYQPTYRYDFDPYPINGIINYSSVYEEFVCFNFPLDTDNYIGFKITENSGDEKLGWIKIKLISQPDGTHRLRLLETAIQK